MDWAVHAEARVRGHSTLFNTQYDKPQIMLKSMLITFLASVFLLIGYELSACNQNYAFVLPNKPYMAPGQDIKVKISVPTANFVSFVDLFVNGQQVDRIEDYPFSWGKPYGKKLPSILQNAEEGTYQIKVVIKDVCGRKHTLTRQVIVKRVVAVYQPYKPLLPLISTLERKYPHSQIIEYKYKGQQILGVKRCARGTRITWFDRKGVALSNVYQSQARFVKSWVNRCQ